MIAAQHCPAVAEVDHTATTTTTDGGLETFLVLPVTGVEMFILELPGKTRLLAYLTLPWR
jgi:hypothetical protein